jgi:hypothetical protein
MAFLSHRVALLIDPHPSSPHFSLDLGYHRIMYINALSGQLQWSFPFDSDSTTPNRTNEPSDVPFTGRSLNPILFFFSFSWSLSSQTHSRDSLCYMRRVNRRPIPIAGWPWAWYYYRKVTVVCSASRGCGKKSQRVVTHDTCQESFLS